MKLFLKISELAAILIVPAVLAVCVALRVQSSALITTLVALISFLPFAIGFERRKPKPAEIMPIVVISAIAVAGRVIVAPIPSFQPVSALVIFSGIFFGRRSGYLVGAFTALVSNMMLGMGPWLPWQMYAWGIMGYFAGVFADRGVFAPGRGIFVFVYAVLMTAVYGIILDTWYVISAFSDASLLAAYAAGFSMNIIHIVSTVFFLSLTYIPWGKKMRRIKTKYNMISN